MRSAEQSKNLAPWRGPKQHVKLWTGARLHACVVDNDACSLLHSMRVQQSVMQMCIVYTVYSYIQFPRNSAAYSHGGAEPNRDI